MLWWRGGDRGHRAFSSALPPVNPSALGQAERRLRAAHTALGVSLQMLGWMVGIREQICYTPGQPPGTVGGIRAWRAMSPTQEQSTVGGFPPPPWRSAPLGPLRRLGAPRGVGLVGLCQLPHVPAAWGELIRNASCWLTGCRASVRSFPRTWTMAAAGTRLA